MRCVVQNSESWKTFFPSCVAEKVKSPNIFSARKPTCPGEYAPLYFSKEVSEGYCEVRVSLLPGFVLIISNLFHVCHCALRYVVVVEYTPCDVFGSLARLSEVKRVNGDPKSQFNPFLCLLT